MAKCTIVRPCGDFGELLLSRFKGAAKEISLGTDGVRDVRHTTCWIARPGPGRSVLSYINANPSSTPRTRSEAEG